MSRTRDNTEIRLLFLTAIVLLLLGIGSLRFANWRVTLGVCLGGALSFLNVYWLKISVKSLFTGIEDGAPVQPFRASLFVFRYALIAAIIGLAAAFGLVSVAATLVGLLSFAFAILLEAFIQIYFIIVNREED